MNIETANRLYDLRKKHNLSQEELAEKLGVSRQAVSKWERSEASPDTDNLIALAKIYGLSLDELVYGEKQQKEDVNNEPKDESRNCGNKVNIGPTGIYVESDDGDKVQINLKGIKITEGKPIEFDDDDDDEDDDDNEDDGVTIIGKDGHIHVNVNNESKRKHNFWASVPYPVICAILYLVFGFCDICGGWALSWIVFITIPLYYSLIDAIYKKRFSEFAYPVFAAFAFLYIGLYHGIWHPSWIIFLTIPVYYPIASAIDKSIQNYIHRKQEKQAKNKK